MIKAQQTVHTGEIQTPHQHVARRLYSFAFMPLIPVLIKRNTKIAWSFLLLHTPQHGKLPLWLLFASGDRRACSNYSARFVYRSSIRLHFCSGTVQFCFFFLPGLGVVATTLRHLARPTTLLFSKWPALGLVQTMVQNNKICPEFFSWHPLPLTLNNRHNPGLISARPLEHASSTTHTIEGSTTQ